MPAEFTCGTLHQELANTSMSNSYPLLRTKLHRPPYDPDIVQRPHLLTRLSAGLRHPFTLVSAPAGFGKSTLLSNWLEQCSLPSTWLSLDSDDNDLSVFLQYLIAAVRVLFPDACAETEALNLLATPPATSVLAHQFVNDLDALGASRAERFVLVLDDYDRISNAAVDELMSILVRRPPQSLRLVIAARRDPTLPLARLRAGGLLTEVRMADLRLQPQEVASFWQKQPHTALDESTIARLDRVVEGWPAGLRLAAISAQFSPDPQQTIAALAESNAHVSDYLFHEILASVPASRQHALVRIAMLDRFCSPLCEAMCAVPDVQGRVTDGDGLVGWLAAANLFLVPLDDEGYWYRFHHLFQQLLRKQAAKLLTAQTRAALHSCASSWFAEAGMLDDALAHAFLIPAPERALAIIEQQRVAVLNQEDWSRMRRWLEMFSPAFFEQTPLLWLIKAHVLQNQFRLAELRAVLDRLDGHPQYEPEAAALRSQQCFWRGDVQQSVDLARYALAALPPEHVHNYGNALVFLGLSLQTSGMEEAGFDRLSHELSSTAPRDVVVTTRVLLALTGMHWAAGNLDYVVRYAQRMVELGEQNHLPAIRNWGRYLAGCAYYWRNELPQAEREFAGVVEKPMGAHAMALLHSHFGLALTYLAQGRSADADKMLDAAFAAVTATGVLAALRLVEAFAAHYALLCGKMVSAAAWAAQCDDEQSRQPLYLLESPWLILVKICLAQGGPAQLERAARVLNGARDFVEETHNRLRKIDVLALEALLHQANNRPEAARAALRQALALAEPARIVRPFVDLGTELGALLHEAAQQGPSAGYAAQLLAAFPHGGQQAIARGALAPGDAATDALEPLTDRELEVLALLAQRLSNKEIGDVLVVSPITVKSHLRNLFGKLGVGSRREAVERARSLGLLR